MIRVLIVEDSPDILFILQTELEWMGYAVETAGDAMTGIETARHMIPDVIISDLRMPGMDGFEFIARIRQISELAAVPAIALTGCSLAREVKLALDSGFTSHLTKPVDAKCLSDMIVQLAGKKTRKAAG